MNNDPTFIYTQTEIRLSEFKNKNQFHIEPWYLPIKNKPTLFSNSSLPLSQQEKKLYLKVYEEKTISNDDITIKDEIGIIEVSKKNAKGIRSMLKGNVFCATEELSSEDIFEIERIIEKEEKEKMIDSSYDITFSFQ